MCRWSCSKGAYENNPFCFGNRARIRCHNCHGVRDEVGAAVHRIAVRDSKDPDGARLTFGCEAWKAFAARVKAATH
jgi:Domain of unknown function (DUF397)